MTRDEVIDMAKEAGFTSGEIAWHDNMFEAFAKLVAEKVSRELAKECAGSGEWNAVHIIEAIRW